MEPTHPEESPLVPALRRTVLSLLLAASALVPSARGASAGTTLPVQVPASPPAAAALDAQVASQQADLAAQAQRLQQAERAAGEALEERQLAERAAAAADREAAAQAARLTVATAAVARARLGLNGFAAAIYRNGGPKLSYVTAALVTQDPGGLLHDVQVAQQVGDAKAQGYTAFRSAEAEQRDAVRRSRAASARATALRERARAAQARSEAAVAAQSALVTAGQARLAGLVDAATQAHRREELLARAEQLAKQRAHLRVPVSALAGALVARPTGRCRGGDLTGYPNGQLPEDALCPLWGTAGQVLRADAAAAFDELSHAYAAESGEPLCVTDSYRSLPEQVAVRAEKPTLAAVPGSSNHGWGVALDLCGGVERFGSPAHLWMQAHAAASGWFHPAWAEPGGGKPEPWHWEYAG